tara:strand:+ start:1094 stop:1333 length:240 start_codon:yes stop_codon:yes gene_type:complete
MEKFNGWTNYETWRVNLEMFDGYEGPLDKDTAKELAEEHIYATTTEGLGRDYALAFIADVNWHEIAGHYEGDYVEETDE